MGVTALVLGGAALLGGAISAKGQADAGKAAKSQSQYQAQVLENNALFREREAADAIDRGKVSVQRNQTRFSQLMGQQRATLASNGILVDTGSAADLVADSARIGRTEDLDIQLAAERESMALLMDAANLRSQAQLAKKGGKNAKKAGQTAALGTLLGSAGSAINIGQRAS